MTSDCCGVDICQNNVCTVASSCKPAGQSCTSPTGSLAGNCCTGSECLNQDTSPQHNGTCGTPMNCKTLGQACGTFVTNRCCSGLTCTGGTCAMPASCASTGAFCTSPSACCANLSCLRFSPKCEPGDIGDPCRSNGDCRAGLTCNGWCTKACASNADCATTFDSPAGVNNCISASTGGFLCFPFCTSNSDCTIYGAGLNCAPGTDPSGGSFNVCG